MENKLNVGITNKHIKFNILPEQADRLVQQQLLIKDLLAELQVLQAVIQKLVDAKIIAATELQPFQALTVSLEKHGIEELSTAAEQAIDSESYRLVKQLGVKDNLYRWFYNHLTELTQRSLNEPPNFANIVENQIDDSVIRKKQCQAVIQASQAAHNRQFFTKALSSLAELKEAHDLKKSLVALAGPLKKQLQYFYVKLQYYITTQIQRRLHLDGHYYPDNCQTDDLGLEIQDTLISFMNNNLHLASAVLFGENKHNFKEYFQLFTELFLLKAAREQYIDDYLRKNLRDQDCRTIPEEQVQQKVAALKLENQIANCCSFEELEQQLSAWQLTEETKAKLAIQLKTIINDAKVPLTAKPLR